MRAMLHLVTAAVAPTRGECDCKGVVQIAEGILKGVKPKFNDLPEGDLWEDV